MEEPRGTRISSVLVALDASPPSLDAMRAAAALAAAMGVELGGIFVEDENLLRAAGLPGWRALGSFSGRPLPLERKALEGGLRAEARRAREALASVAEGEGLGWSFRVARGMVAAEILAAASETGLVVLGRAGWHGPRLGSTARAVALGTPGAALVAGRDAREGSTIVVLYDGSAASGRALSLAVALAGGRGLKVVVPANGTPSARSPAAAAGSLLAGHVVPADVVPSPVAETWDHLTRLVERERAGMLVLPAETEAGSGLIDLLEEARCPVMLVR